MARRRTGVRFDGRRRLRRLPGVPGLPSPPQPTDGEYLSIGLILPTAVSFGVAFVGSVLLRQGVLPSLYQQPLTLVARMCQFLGVLFIAYSLHRRE